jgi:hypothetical protein
MMRKAAGVFVTVALIIALVGMWLKSPPVATKSTIAAGVEATGAISPFQLTLRNGEALPNQYYRDPF